MAKSKKMDESDFQKIVKDITVYAESIRSKQNEKQTVMNSFDIERKRFKSGKISRTGLNASLPKIRKEINRLDKNIRTDIQKLQSTANRVKDFAARQSPEKHKVSPKGISSGKKKKKHSHRRKRR